MIQNLILSLLTIVFYLPANISQAANESMIYGSQMMTQQERNEYRMKIQNATSAEERERIRNEHHQAMQQRAKEQGYTLPENPPSGGGGGMMHKNPGYGDGMGPHGTQRGK